MNVTRAVTAAGGSERIGTGPQLSGGSGEAAARVSASQRGAGGNVHRDALLAERDGG